MDKNVLADPLRFMTSFDTIIETQIQEVNMKKLISAITACTLAVCSLVSCGDNNTDIVGKWSIDDTSIFGGVFEEAGFIFSEDGTGSIYENTSSLMSLTDSGFNMNGTVIGTEYISTSGDTLSIDVAGQNLFSLTRITAGSGQYDGKYSLNSCIMYDSLVSGMEEHGINKENLKVTIEFNGSSSELVMNDLFTYKVSGKTMIIEGIPGFFTNDEDSKAGALFSIDGDTLTLKGKKAETLTRVG